MFRLLPREEKFFDLFEQQGANIVAAGSGRGYGGASPLSRRRAHRVLGNLLRHASLLGRPRRSTYRGYASRRGLPRASSGSQLAPVPGPN